MSRYINLEEAIEAYRKSLEQNKSFVSMLQKLPSVAIVHCGECKCCRGELIEEHMPLYIYCEKWNHETGFDDFCSAGERIEE